MKINDGIRALWQERFFETVRTPKEIGVELFARYKLTVSNMSAHLASCGAFLRRQNGGWVQKMPFAGSAAASKKINYFDLYKIHPAIRLVCEKLFEDEHYDLAIFEAFKKINNLVKEKSNRSEDGTDLMMKVFNKENPVLQFNDLKTTTDKDLQDGRRFLFAGAMLAIRNPRGHDGIVESGPITDPFLAIQYLILASILARYVGDAYLSKPRT